MSIHPRNYTIIVRHIFMLWLLLTQVVTADAAAQKNSRKPAAPVTASQPSSCAKCRKAIGVNWNFCRGCGTPIQQYGRLYIVTPGVDGLVSIDGVIKGRTGREIGNVRVGTRSISVTADSYRPQTASVKVAAGVVNRLPIILVKKTGSVSILATGIDDEILVADQSYGKSPRTIDGLLPGTYPVKIKAAKYRTRMIDVVVRPETVATIDPMLQREAGTVAIAATGTKDEIEFNGRSYGSFPARIDQVETGEYRLSIKAPGRKPYVRTITVAVDAVTEIVPELSFAPGSITVAATGHADEVFLNDKSYGPSPIAVNVDPGTYKLQIRAPGYKLVNREVAVLPEIETPVRIDLVRAVGSIQIHATGKADEVSVDGKSYGPSPVRIPDVEPGTHQIVIDASGFKRYSREIGVKVDETAEVTPTLDPDVGTLSIADTGVRDQVFVNGVSKGPSPVKLSDLPPGKYTIRIVADGYELFETDRIVMSGKVSDVTTVLLKATGSLKVIDSGRIDTVYVDGIRKGGSPVVVEKLNPGRHTVRVEAEGFTDYETVVTVVAGGEHLVLPLLVAKLGEIRIHFIGDATTIGLVHACRIWIDGVEVTKPIAGSVAIYPVPVGAREIRVLPILLTPNGPFAAQVPLRATCNVRSAEVIEYECPLSLTGFGFVLPRRK